MQRVKKSANANKALAKDVVDGAALKFRGNDEQMDRSPTSKKTERCKRVRYEPVFVGMKLGMMKQVESTLDERVHRVLASNCTNFNRAKFQPSKTLSKVVEQIANRFVVSTLQAASMIARKNKKKRCNKQIVAQAILLKMPSLLDPDETTSLSGTEEAALISSEFTEFLKERKGKMIFYNKKVTDFKSVIRLAIQNDTVMIEYLSEYLSLPKKFNNKHTTPKATILKLAKAACAEGKSFAKLMCAVRDSIIHHCARMSQVYCVLTASADGLLIKDKTPLLLTPDHLSAAMRFAAPFTKIAGNVYGSESSMMHTLRSIDMQLSSIPSRNYIYMPNVNIGEKTNLETILEDLNQKGKTSAVGRKANKNKKEAVEEIDDDEAGPSDGPSNAWGAVLVNDLETPDQNEQQDQDLQDATGHWGEEEE